MRKVIVCNLAAFLFWSGAVTANPLVADRYVPQAGKVGGGVLTYFFWDVYEAALYAPGSVWRPDAPFALTLSYKRDLKGRDIAARTITEIRDQGFAEEAKLSDWLTRLTALFPDVGDGDSLTAIRDAAGRTLFYGGSRQIGAIDDPAFGRRFFDIWLGEKTSEPKLRRKLLGG